MSDETRVVLIKPGDVLLIGSAPSVEPEAWRQVVERLFQPLGVHVAAFADDIQIDRLAVDQTAIVEELSEAAHEAWMETKAAQGVTSRASEWAEELMVPYAELSERAKDLDRGTVRGVLAAIERAGYDVVPLRARSGTDKEDTDGSYR